MIYLINKETKKIVETFDNIIDWSSDFVEFKTNLGRNKFYCAEDEYYTDKYEEVEI